MRLSDLVDLAAIAAIAGGLGVRFGWWLAAIVAGLVTLVVNWVRSRS